MGRKSLVAILIGLAMASAVAVPDGTDATSLRELKKLTASDGEAGDLLGRSVSISGDIAVVGAWKEDAMGENAGAAYVFQRILVGSDQWDQVKKLTASDGETEDRFGIAVAISGDTVVVGSHFEDAGEPDAGAAYVYRRDEGGTDNWGEVAKLTARDGETGDHFGVSVAISDEIVVVGAPSEDAGGRNAGAAYVFQRNEGGANGWGQIRKLEASDARALDGFGNSVGASGDTIVVGAFGHDERGTNAGVAYVFRRDGGGPGNWGEVAKLIASDAESGDWLGTAVAVSGDTALIGALGRDDGGTDSGGAYIFRRNAGGSDVWAQIGRATAPDAQVDAWFGASVALDGDIGIVGAHQAGGAGRFAGAAYVLHRNEGGADKWGGMTKLAASDAHAFDFFGTSVAVSGDTVLVGAESEDAGASNAGAAYLFDLQQPKRGTIGDADCSGLTTSIDAALVLQFDARLSNSLDCPDLADVDQSGAVNSVDAALILQLVAGVVISLAP